MKKIILDTDIGGDCDDMGALAIIHNACKAGKIELKGITLSTNNPYSAACADAVNRYYQNIVPIGQTKSMIPGDKGVDYEEFYGKYIAERYKNAYFPSKKIPKDSITILRRILSENEGGKITICSIGFCTNLADLIESKGDKYSSLEGKELIESSVEKIIMMGCYFPDENVPKMECGGKYVSAEWNIKADIKSAQKLFSLSPVPIVICPFSVGYKMMTGGELVKREKGNPVAVAYMFYSQGERDSWDPATVYYGIYEDEECFSLTDKGKVQIDDEGVSTFSFSLNGNCQIMICKNRELTRRRIDFAMCEGQN